MFPFDFYWLKLTVLFLCIGERDYSSTDILWFLSFHKCRLSSMNICDYRISVNLICLKFEWIIRYLQRARLRHYHFVVHQFYFGLYIWSQIILLNIRVHLRCASHASVVYNLTPVKCVLSCCQRMYAFPPCITIRKYILKSIVLRVIIINKTERKWRLNYKFKYYTELGQLIC